jgi:electron transfer flavoprotein beta subunit
LRLQTGVKTMKILVLVKHVPDATGDRRFAEDGTVDRAGSDGLLSELDEYAVEDGSMGVIPAMIAERLGWPAATLGATLSLDGNTVTIRRDADTASLTVEADLPAVVSVTDQSGEARYPSMKGILAAKKKPVDTWSLADLGIDRATIGLDAAVSKVLEVTPRPPKEAGKVVTDEGGSGAAAFVDFLTTGKYI